MMQALIQELIDQFDDERRALARQLHSGALQQLAALQMRLSLIRDPSAELAVELAKSCVAEIRAVGSRLYPPLLDEAGLAAAVRAFAAENGVTVLVEFPEDAKLPPRVALGAFRIIEELAVRAAPGTVALRLQSGSLIISAAGIGADADPCLRARVARLQGQQSYSAAGGAETAVIKIPVTSEES